MSISYKKPDFFISALDHYLANRISLAAICFESFLQELERDNDNLMFQVSETEYASKQELKVITHRYLCLIYFYGLNGLVDYSQALYHGEQAVKLQDGVSSILTAVMYIKDSIENPSRIEEGKELINLAMKEGDYTELLNSLSKQVPILKEVVEQLSC